MTERTEKVRRGLLIVRPLDAAMIVQKCKRKIGPSLQNESPFGWFPKGLSISGYREGLDPWFIGSL